MSKILVCSYEKELLPSQGTSWSACWDISCSESFEIKSWQIAKIKTGIKTVLPQWRWVKIYARSSLASKIGLMLANHVAIVDSDYRGEYLLQLYNFTSETVKVEKKTRLAQIEFFPHFYINKGESKFWTTDLPNLEYKVNPELFSNFAETFPSERGEWWFGSTGK